LSRDDDERLMLRALDLARRPPFTSPNPRVGSVVVRNGDVVGEGWHEGSGTAHAEAAALAGIDAAGATLYTNLEPCMHHGHTPPCAPAIVAAGIVRVVAAIEDPDPRVSGRGFGYLASKGISVTTGVCAAEARRLNAAYLHQRITRRPYVTVKLAFTLDGRLSAPDGSARWITGEGARRRVHARRLEADAVLIGAGSVVADDPLLTARDVGAGRQPVRVVVDALGKVPASASLLRDQDGGQVIIATTDESHEHHADWKETGAEVLVLPPSRMGVDLDALLENLGARNFVEVYCEGGAELTSSLLRDDFVNRLEFHYGPVVVGRGGPDLGDVGVRSIGDARRWDVVRVEALDGDVLITLEKPDARVA
jgi:diaminohydroxyphosphoribosylaminopyrimidine deaminase/5-amino-6-(5-phosphoribosylamino)uracil reductase